MIFQIPVLHKCLPDSGVVIIDNLCLGLIIPHSFGLSAEASFIGNLAGDPVSGHKPLLFLHLQFRQ
jgi:hypothetical protein